MSIDITETKAKALVTACQEQGLDARLFWDRGPFACQVMLTDGYPDDEAPCIFFAVEDSDTYRIPVGNDGKNGGWVWHAQVQMDRDHPSMSDMFDVGITVVERTWLGDSEATVARKIALFLNAFTFNGLEPA